MSLRIAKAVVKRLAQTRRKALPALAALSKEVERYVGTLGVRSCFFNTALKKDQAYIKFSISPPATVETTKLMDAAVSAFTPDEPLPSEDPITRSGDMPAAQKALMGVKSFLDAKGISTRGFINRTTDGRGGQLIAVTIRFPAEQLKV